MKVIDYIMKIDEITTLRKRYIFGIVTLDHSISKYLKGVAIEMDELEKRLFEKLNQK